MAKIRKPFDDDNEDVAYNITACERCLEKMWIFRYIQGFLLGTCGNCGNAIEVPYKEMKHVILQNEANKDVSYNIIPIVV